MVADKTPVCRKCRFSRLLTFFSAAISLDSGPVNWSPVRNALSDLDHSFFVVVSRKRCMLSTSTQCAQMSTDFLKELQRAKIKQFFTTFDTWKFTFKFAVPQIWRRSPRYQLLFLTNRLLYQFTVSLFDKTPIQPCQAFTSTGTLSAISGWKTLQHRFWMKLYNNR